MAKNATDIAEAPVVEAITMSLHEFCSRLSLSTPKPELIGGFEFSERVAGNLVGTEAEFKSRFELFINKPV